MSNPVIDICGIYILYFESIIDRFYVGLSQDIKSRIGNHFSRLRSNSHTNSELQEAYNSVNVLPVFEVLENCTKDDLGNREIYWIKQFDAYTEGFNGNGGGVHSYGANHPRANHTEDRYKAILLDIANTEDSLIYIAENNYVSYETVRDISCGKTHKYLQEEMPEEYSKMLAKSGTRTSKLYSKDVYASIVLTIANSTLSLKEVSESLKVSYQVVRNIAYGTNHKYLENEYPSEYTTMRSKTRLNKGGKWQVTQ